MTVLPIGGTFTYASPATGSGPMATITDGALHVSATTTGTDDGSVLGRRHLLQRQYPADRLHQRVGFVGVQFDIAGVVSGNGCSVQYSTNDSAHMDAMLDPKGSGPPGAYPPQAPLTIPPTTTTMMMPFTGPLAPSGGNPQSPSTPSGSWAFSGSSRRRRASKAAASSTSRSTTSASSSRSASFRAAEVLAARLSAENLREAADRAAGAPARRARPPPARRRPRGRDAVGCVLGAAVDDTVADDQQRAAAGRRMRAICKMNCAC